MLKEKILTIKNEEPMHNKQSYRNDNDVKIAILENSVGHINQTLERIEKRLDKIDVKFEKIDERFNKIDGKLEKMDKKIDDKIDSLNNRLWINFYWILGAIGVFPFITKLSMKWMGI